MQNVANARIIKSHPSYIKWEDVNGGIYVAMTNREYWGLPEQANETFNIIRANILKADTDVT